MSTQMFNILVVDDNVTCLNIISSMLRRWKYEVITVNCPLKALAVTRTQDIDLILSDFHMPKMNGLELQKQVEAESKLPVIIMSSDDNEKIIFKSLSSGAVFFISKPVNLMDLKNLWQYAIASKRDISMRYIEKIKSIQAAGSLAIGGTSYNDENNFALFGNEGRHTENKKDNRRKFQKKNKEKEEGESSTTLKKAKVNWNHALHNRFMQAIRHITLEKAVPKNILEFMNVPGLTRENVASHLQKYRLFLKKVGENGSLATTKNSMTLDRTFRSGFAAGHSSVMLNNSQETHSPFKGVENQTSALYSFNPTNNSSLASFSSSSYGFGQSRLLVGNSNTQANVHKPFLGNINPLYQSNRTGGFWLESNDIGINMPSGGVAMPMNGTSSLQIPNNLYSNMSTASFKSSGIWNPSYGAAGNNNVESTRTGNVSFSYSNSNMNHSNTNRCPTVLQMNNGGSLMAEGGQLRLNGGLSGPSDFGLSLVNNRSLGVEAVGDSAFGTFLTPIKSFSTGRNPGNNQCPTSFSSVSFVQGSTSTLPSVAQQQFSLDDNELNHFVSGFMNDDNNIASGFSEPHQFKDAANIMMETTNSQFLFHQQQGGERVENSNLTSDSSCSLETNLPTSQPQDDLEFPTSLNVEENRPWDEPSLEQLLEIQELLNSDSEDNIMSPSDQGQDDD